MQNYGGYFILIAGLLVLIFFGIVSIDNQLDLIIAAMEARQC